MIKGDSKHIQKIAKELIDSHLSDGLSRAIDRKDSIDIAKSHAIISAQLCCDQWELAPNILMWKNVIQAIRDYKYD